MRVPIKLHLQKRAGAGRGPRLWRANSCVPSLPLPHNAATRADAGCGTAEGPGSLEPCTVVPCAIAPGGAPVPRGPRIRIASPARRPGERPSPEAGAGPSAPSGPPRRLRPSCTVRGPSSRSGSRCPMPPPRIHAPFPHTLTRRTNRGLFLLLVTLDCEHLPMLRASQKAHSRGHTPPRPRRSAMSNGLDPFSFSLPYVCRLHSI